MSTKVHSIQKQKQRRQPVSEEYRFPHIKRYIDRVRATDLGAGRQFVMNSQEAKDLSADLQKLLLEISSQPRATTEFPTAIDGGGFKSV